MPVLQTLWLLFIEFFKTGLFSMGGGLATLPFLREMTQRYAWFTAGELADMIAIAESTPGPIGINMAVYAGFHAAGIWGAVTATFAIVLPSYIIIVLIAMFMQRFRQNKFMDALFDAVRPASVALIASALFWMLHDFVLRFNAPAGAGGGLAIAIFGGTVQLLPVILFVAFVALMNLKPLSKVHPLAFIGLGAVVGVVAHL